MSVNQMKKIFFKNLNSMHSNVGTSKIEFHSYLINFKYYLFHVQYHLNVPTHASSENNF